MAEHCNQVVEPEMSPLSRIGKPLGENARSAAYEHCKQMGLNSARSWECVQSVATQLEKDRPYEAQAAGMRFLDLTGTYRLFAVLLTAD
jgi:hypothetical protein